MPTLSCLTGPLYGGLSLSSHLSDLPGLSGRRMLEALAEGETDPARIAALAAQGVRATQQELCDALSAAATLSEIHLSDPETVSGTADVAGKSDGHAGEERRSGFAGI
jgi:hypothetical protein